VQIKKILIRVLLTAWLIICLSFFLLACRVNYLQLFLFPSPTILLESLRRIAPIHYLLNILTSLGGISIFSLACLSLGMGLLKSMVKSAPDLALSITAFVLGEIIFSLTFLLLINLNWLTPASVIIILLVGFLTGSSTLRNWIPRLHGYSLPFQFQRLERIILGLLASIFAFGLLYSSSRLGYDSVAEYFSHAKIMAVSQRPIFFYPTDSFVVSSFHPGILLTAMIQLFGDQAARMLPWMNGLASVLLGLSLGKELGLTPRARLWFLTLILTSTAFVDLLGDGKIELISTAPILAAVYWMLRGLEQPSRGTYFLIGTLAGFGIISRPYNIFLVSVFVSIFYASQIYLQVKSKTFHAGSFIQPILWMLPPLVILGVFHLFENWFFLHSPIAPISYARNLQITDWQWQFNPTQLNAYRLLYPFVVTFINSPQSLGNISPFVVIFLPCLLIKKIRHGIHPSSQMKWLSAIALVTLLLWINIFFTVVEIRYVFFLWIILFLFTAQVMEGVLGTADDFTRPIGMSLLIGVLLIISVRTLIIPFGTFSPIDLNGQPHCYNVVICMFFDDVNQSASIGDRVFTLNAYRYYLRPDLFACSSRSNEYAVLQKLASQNSPEFWIEVYQQGFRFVTYETNFSVRHSHFGTIPDPSLAPSWLHIKTLYTSNKNLDVVYRLEADGVPIPVKTTCSKNENGGWEIMFTP
jgi:hypothetical protein